MKRFEGEVAGRRKTPAFRSDPAIMVPGDGNGWTSTMQPANRSDLTSGYLRRLGLDHPGAPSVAALRTLHRAHVEQVPYEALDIQLQRPTSIDPVESARRIASCHRGGYCYHLNGAFSLLLRALGYTVMWHRAGVQNHSDADAPGVAWANHLTLTVHGLSSDDCPAGVWLVDVGLGDALYEPLPLSPGRYRQGPFRYRLRRSDREPGGWRFDHDPMGSFAGMDFRLQPATVDDFAERHRYLSTSPHSGFVRTCCVLRRDATGIEFLRGRVLGRVGSHGYRRTIDTQAEWFEALADVFDLPVPDIGPRERRDLWNRVRRAHEARLHATSTPRFIAKRRLRPGCSC
jgi:N-hydroxyarylamine O-acetyltransferase